MYVGLFQEIMQLVDRVCRLGENLRRVELGENARPASIGQPDRQHVDGVSSRKVCCNAGNLAAGQEGLDGLEGLELDPSCATRSSRGRQPVETRRRRNHPGIGGQEDRAIRSRGTSGGIHNHGLWSDGGHCSAVSEGAPTEGTKPPQERKKKTPCSRLHAR